MRNFHALIFQLGVWGALEAPRGYFSLCKKKAISFIFNKLLKVDPSRINHNKNKELKKRQRWSTINGKSTINRITGNKRNIWSERERKRKLTK